MIKVNLLDSVTDRARGAAVVEQRVANPRTRSMMLLGAVAAVMLLGIAFDYLSANSAHASAQAELERQQATKAKMEQVNKEQAELETKVKDIQVRIDAIKRLRASQQGPVAVLSAINQRLPNPEFRLETIEQKAGELMIEGHSPDEAAVTQFGRSLEFSSGLFTNVSIETQRRALEVNSADYNSLPGQLDPDAPKPETVRFKIRARYVAPGSQQNATDAAGAAAPAAANQVAQK